MHADGPLQQRADPIPVWVLLGLVLAVLMAHAVLLRKLALGLDLRAPTQTRAFTTRSIEVKAVAAAVRRPSRAVSKTPAPPRPPPKPARPRTDGVMASANRAPPPVQPAQPELPVESVPESLMDLQAKPIADTVTAQVPAPEQELPVAAPLPPATEPPAPPAESPATPATESPAPAAPAEPPGLAATTPIDGTAVLADAQAPALRPYKFPGSIRLRFDAFGKKGRLEYRAGGALIWLHDGTDYEARMELGTWIVGTRVLTSFGKLTTAGLAPRRFSDKFRSERAAHFDRRENRIVFSANTPPARLLAGAQDQISIFVQLAALVAGDPLGFPIDSTVAFQTAGPRDAEPWVFTVEREEMLNLTVGQIPALKLVRRPNKDYGQKVEVWLAPELSYLPARIQITFANGDFIDQQWRSSSPP